MFTLIDSRTRVLNLDIKKGLFYDRPATQIEPGGFSATANTIIHKNYLKARPGCSSLYDILPASQEVFHMDRYVDLSNNVYLMAVGRVKTVGTLSFYYWNATTLAWVDITGSLSLSCTHAQNPSSCSFAGKWLFCCGGACDLVYWAGTGNCAKVTNADSNQVPHPKPYFVFANSSRVFLGNIEDGLGTRIQYRIDSSDYLVYNSYNPGTDRSSKYQDLMTESDPVVTGATLKDTMVVYKDRKIYTSTSIEAPLFFAFRGASSGIGCIAPRTLVEYKEAHIFLGDDNVYMLSLGSGVKAIGDPIAYRIDDLIENSYVRETFALLDKHNYQYTLFLPKKGTTSLNSTLTLDLKTGAWTEGEIDTAVLQPRCGSSYHSGPWNSIVHIGAEESYIYKYSSLNTLDGTTAFVPSATFSILDSYLICQTMIAHYEQLFIETTSGVVHLYAKYGNQVSNMSASWIDLGEVDYSRPNKQPCHFSFSIQARYIQFKITFPDHSKFPEVSSINLHYKPMMGIVTN